MLVITALALTALIWAIQQMGYTSPAWKSALATMAIVSLCIAFPGANILLDSYVGLSIIAALWGFTRAGIGWAMGPHVSKPRMRSMAWGAGGWTVALVVSSGG